ncbi:hypothetical protein KAR91_50905 [Candidatus Pacearchaeota archaeon]|nr:hypothetical protein [Candidatus Pacearchaeota archaeon]
MTKMLEVSDETYEKIKDQLEADEKVEINGLVDFVGQKIFVRTVTYHLIGRVTKIVGGLVFLEKASWIADSGRFMQAIRDGKLNEVEPVGDWFFSIGSLVDGCLWRHDLPEAQK